MRYRDMTNAQYERARRRDGLAREFQRVQRRQEYAVLTAVILTLMVLVAVA